MIILALIAIINFWLLCIVFGVGFAFGKYAYQEFLEFLYEDLSVIDKAIRKFVKKHYELLRTYRDRLKQEKYMRDELPELRRKTRLGSRDALAERLMHVKHIRTSEGILTGEEFARGQN